MHNIDVLLVTEAHLSEKISFRLDGYNTYATYHPDNTSHAGTAIVIKRSMKHNVLPEYRTAKIQATSVLIFDKQSAITLSSVYCPPAKKRHPGPTEDDFNSFFLTLGNRVIAGGDWNAKHTVWGSRITTTRGRQLHKSICQHQLNILSTGQATHYPTDPNKLPDLLDFFVYRGVHSQFLDIADCLDSSSDHIPQIVTMSSTIIQRPAPAYLYNNRTDWDAFHQYLHENLDLKICMKTEEDIDNATEYITKSIQTAAWLSTPPPRMVSKISVNQNVPHVIKEKILEKRRLRRVWHCSRHPADKRDFNRAAAELKRLLIDAENETLEVHLQNLTPSAPAKNEYSLWKAVKSREKPQTSQLPIKNENGSWAKTDQERAEAFALFLSTVFTTNDDISEKDTNQEVKTFLESDLQLSLPVRSCTPAEVRRTVHELDLKKAPGFDLITAEVLRNLPRKAFVLITSLFNSILRSAYYPSAWKVSQITMVPKPGKPPHLRSSYRPISLLPVLSKVFEKVVAARLNAYLTENAIIPEHQFGFRRCHSTIEQVHRVCDHIRNALENKKYCSGVFLDVQQAFDKVWHDGLKYKLKKTLPHNMYLLLKSYLENRIFYVRVNDAFSDFYEIKAGVPQGSVLGPLLYLLFTADVPESDNVMTATFADDTAILSSDTNPGTASINLQMHLDKVHSWMKSWRIKASASKSNHITFTLRKEDCPPVKLGQEDLPHNTTVKYLGFHLDRKQTWKTHIQKKRDECNHRFRTLEWLLGRRSRLSVENKILIYKAVLKPVWTYGIQLWGSAKTSNTEILQRFQNGVLKSIANAPWYTRMDELHEYLNMPTVKQEIVNNTRKYRDRIVHHRNKLAQSLSGTSYIRRLKRKNTWDNI